MGLWRQRLDPVQPPKDYHDPGEAQGPSMAGLMDSLDGSTRFRQVGGSHYARRAIQPWDIIQEYGLDFWEGNALKYLLRWREKGGAEDLRKAQHYLDHIIEREVNRDR